MSLGAQREAIVHIVEETDGIKGKAKVYEYQRLAKSWKNFVDLFKTDQDKIHVWCVTRIQTQEHALTNCEVMRYHQWVIRGYMSVQDAKKSELTMQNIVENICNNFREDIDLQGQAEPGGDDIYKDIGLPQVDMFEPRMFGSVLVHFVEIKYRSKERFDNISL